MQLKVMKTGATKSGNMRCNVPDSGVPCWITVLSKLAAYWCDGNIDICHVTLVATSPALARLSDKIQEYWIVEADCSPNHNIKSACQIHVGPHSMSRKAETTNRISHQSTSNFFFNGWDVTMLTSNLFYATGIQNKPHFIILVNTSIAFST